MGRKHILCACSAHLRERLAQQAQDEGALCVQPPAIASSLQSATFDASVCKDRVQLFFTASGASSDAQYRDH